MIRLFSILLLVAASAFAKPVTILWDNQPDWPSGTTVEVEANGVVSQGNTGTSVVMDVPYQNYINIKARAVTPTGFQCGDPLVDCPYSPYVTLVAYKPDDPINIWGQKTWTGLGTTTMATDDFNRANETPLAGNWAHSTGGGALRLSGNQVIGPATSGDTFAYYTPGTLSADQSSKITVTSTAGAMDMGAAVRISDSALTGYWVSCFNGTLEIAKLVNGSYSTVAGGFGTVTAGDIIELKVVGTTLQVFKNGTQVGTNQTDTSIATGRYGIFAYNSAITLDNWEGTDLSTGSASFLFNNNLRFANLMGI
jgi:hypothetical protein